MSIIIEIIKEAKLNKSFSHIKVKKNIKNWTLNTKKTILIIDRILYDFIFLFKFLINLTSVLFTSVELIP